MPRISFKSLVLIQAVIILLYLPVYELLLQLGYNLDIPAIRLFYMIISGVYGYLLYLMVRLHVQNKRIVKLSFIILVVIYILSFLSENPFFNLIDNKDWLRAVIHIILVTFEIMVIVFAIKDLLSENKTLAQKLWAAVATYFLINFSWGGFYDLLNIIIPGSLGPNIKTGFASYLAGITYSFSIIGGGDRLYNASRFIVQFSKIQSLWCSMYMIFLIGQFRAVVKKEG
ncbi:MAG TPA: hypothetical protein VK590_07315 [Saprospiraceae bacterium]|nr:hypothetical protein [Saprospiraceae bacterium]